MPTIIEQLAAFTSDIRCEDIPRPVIEESKRLILDSLGVAMAATDVDKGRIGVEYGRLMGGSGDATILGTRDRVSIFGAAFANGELINAMDMDAVLPPGHVTPYTLPGALAVAEAASMSGSELLSAVAVSHEMSYRIGKSMDYLRDVEDGKASVPPIYGYSSTIFGATAAIAMLQRQSKHVMTESLGLAGMIPPAQSMQAFFQHVPSTTIKYLMAGVLTQAAMTAAHMGLAGHRGDRMTLDDTEFGFPRFIGTRRWEPKSITSDLGSRWGFITQQTYKPYPHCRILHGPLECVIDIVRTNRIGPEEIEEITVWVEAFADSPVWTNREVHNAHDAQFSMPHGIAMGAHGFALGKAWLDQKNILSPSVLRLMGKVTCEPHPDYVKALSVHPSARPTMVKVKARGRTFTSDLMFPKGSPSPDPSTTLSLSDLIAKFRHNVEGVIDNPTANRLVDQIMDLDRIENFTPVMRLTARGA